MAVRGVDVGPNVDEEIHNVVVGPTDGIVEGGDALIVGLTGVIQLARKRRNTVSLSSHKNEPIAHKELGITGCIWMGHS